MTTAAATTNEQGHTSELCTKIGTGGHGDSSRAYTKDYKLRDSMVTVIDRRVKTGLLDMKGKPVYKIYYKRVNRARVLIDVRDIDFMAFEALSKIFSNPFTGVECKDLINDEGVKIGLSIVIGKYEARVIGGKCQLMDDGVAVRSFREVKK